MNYLLNDENDLLPIIEYNTKLLKLGRSSSEEARLVYTSGFYLSLLVAMCYEEAGRPEVDERLWSFLTTIQHPELSTGDYVKKISEYSGGHIVIGPNLIPNQAFRYGLYGNLYVKGIKDSLDLCVNVVPEIIMKKSFLGNRAEVSNWISRQMLELNPFPETMKIKYVND